MKSMLTALAIVAFLAIAFTPTASARDVPTLPTGTSVDGNCVVLWDIPDYDHRVCHSVRGSCKVYEERSTMMGYEYRCLVGSAEGPYPTE